MGAVTLANKVDGVVGNKRVVEADVTFSDAYATGGDTASKATLGLTEIDYLAVVGVQVDDQDVDVAHTHGASVELGGTHSAPTVILYENGAEATAASDQSAVTVRVRFHGS